MVNGKDSWSWLGRDRKGFSVKAVKNFLRSGLDHSGNFVLSWSKWIPKKCNIHMWRLGLNRIPTMMALKSRNCDFGDLACGLCGSADETGDHLFCDCRIAMEVWNYVGSWCRLAPIFLFSRMDIFDIHQVEGLNKKGKELVKGIIYTTVWCLWKARNEKRFSNISIDSRRILQDIKTYSFLWYSNRASRQSIDWKNWYLFNIL